jgi:hypothetical protein
MMFCLVVCYTTGYDLAFLEPNLVPSILESVDMWGEGNLQIPGWIYPTRKGALESQPIPLLFLRC